MFDVSILLVCIIVVALIFDFTNGAHDSANAIATIVSTRVVSPRLAVSIAAILNLLGALLGTEVAKTLGEGLVLPQVVVGSHHLVLAALLAAITWNCITWFFGIPSSSSHALVGGLAGATWAEVGLEALNVNGIINKVIIPMIASPFLGFSTGFLLMWAIYWLFARVHRHTVNSIFRKLQCCSASFMAISHGLNDAQKTMGIVTLALFTFGEVHSLDVPLWVKLCCACAMASGTALGGWKIVRTMGGRIFRLEPVHGFTAECSATLVITGASLFGAPISTTQTISATIFGVGSTQRLSAVRWGVARQLISAWILTLPATGLLGFIILSILHCF